jgi:hypothetical protein
MSNNEATKLTPEEWMKLWQEIERSNRRTVFSDWDEFSSTIEQDTEMSDRAVPEDRYPVLKRIGTGLDSIVSKVMGHEIDQPIYQGNTSIDCIKTGQELVQVERLEFYDGAMRESWTVRLEVAVIHLSETEWELQMSWQLESILLEMRLSVPELYHFGRSVAVGWLQEIEAGFGKGWHLGASSYWLEAFRHTDAVLGDTVVRQRALVNLTIS